MKRKQKRYRIKLLGTAEGINYKKDKTEDTVIIFLWAKNAKEVRKLADMIASSLIVSTHIGSLEYVVKSIHPLRLPLTKNEKKMLKEAIKDMKHGRVLKLL